MIMSYDKVEKSALKLLETCRYLQATAENDLIANELLGLSNCIQNLLPKFSAAGFFDVNQRLIPGFLSAVTAYVIILIQFRV
ncbi:uncharacterized protein [Leptinotarsa decemlineata]|uniref:uncharacterized protein n=1 Tax=Leptinotarsa decemlineata TaxID=7539 RepID=UPI003D30CC7F